MSELNNPLFEDQREFLERQKQEYKNALLSDVTQLKNQSQKLGKTVLIAGGALAGIWMVSSMLGGKKKDKNRKQLKSAKTPLLLHSSSKQSAEDVIHSDGSLDYSNALHQDSASGQPTGQYTNHYTKQSDSSANQSSAAGNIAQAFFQSDMAKALTQQLTAFLLVYLSKKAEEFLHDSKNNDIAVSKESETKDIDFAYHDEDAV